MSLTKLQILNLLRWIKAHLFAWGVLGFIYTLSISVLLKPLIESQMHFSLSVGVLCLAIWGAVIIPLGIERGIRGSVGVFARFFGPGLGVEIYVKQELRRLATWVAIFGGVGLGVWALSAYPVAWIFIAQFSVQRALYSIDRWRTLTLITIRPNSDSAAVYLLKRFVASQVLIYGLTLIPVGIFAELGAQAVWAGLGAVISGSAVAMEGDSGRPWLSNLISLVAGTLGGLLCWMSPWVLIGVVYFLTRMLKLSNNRAFSVELFHEDTLIS